MKGFSVYVKSDTIIIVGDMKFGTHACIMLFKTMLKTRYEDKIKIESMWCSQIPIFARIFVFRNIFPLANSLGAGWHPTEPADTFESVIKYAQLEYMWN